MPVVSIHAAKRCAYPADHGRRSRLWAIRLSRGLGRTIYFHGNVPPFNMRMERKLRGNLHLSLKPSKEAIPLLKVSPCLYLPAELLNQPVCFSTVSYH